MCEEDDPDFIALRGDPSDNCLALPESVRNAPLNWCNGTARLMGSSRPVSFKPQAEMLRLFRLIATMDALAPLPSLADQKPTWASASTLAPSWRLNQLADRLG
jgi:hypothetical protein